MIAYMRKALATTMLGNLTDGRGVSRPSESKSRSNGGDTDTGTGRSRGALNDIPSAGPLPMAANPDTCGDPKIVKLKDIRYHKFTSDGTEITQTIGRREKSSHAASISRSIPSRQGRRAQDEADVAITCLDIKVGQHT